ncbi:14481_t:CDS:1, partial [Racocetra fulgida]
KSSTSNLNDSHDEPELNSSDNSHLQKRVRIEDVNDEQSDRESYADEKNTSVDLEQEEGESSGSYQENSSQNRKRKKSGGRCLRNALRSHDSTTDSTK